MTGLITAIIGVADKALELINLKESRKYVDKMNQIQTELMKEESRGYNSDDAKIEALQKELKITLEALKDDLILSLASKK